MASCPIQKGETDVKLLPLSNLSIHTGIVATISTFLAQRCSNITYSSQIDDQETGYYFAQIGFLAEAGAEVARLRKVFVVVAAPFEIALVIQDAYEK